MSSLTTLETKILRKVKTTKEQAQAHFCRYFTPLPEIRLSTITGKSAQRRLPVFTEDICLPPYHGGCGHDDFSPLANIVEYIDPQVIVELGTAYGNLTANLCNLCPSAFIHTVNAPADLQTGTSVTYSLSKEEIGRVYREHGFDQRVNQILSNTLNLDLRPHLRGRPIDFAIIDACHDSEFVLNDFEKVHPFIRPGGIVLFHDTHPSLAAHLAGSYLACSRLRKRGLDICHLSCTWWAVWANGKPHRSRRGA